jgi:3-isopropylmalate/(R)-2-methylmalate dehydratase large subunit
MGMTMTQKILAKGAGLDRVEAGQLIEAKLNLVLGNDITAPVAIGEFDKAGFEKIFDRDKIALVLDHYTPCKDIKAAQLCAVARNFAKRFQITHFYDVGTVGGEHALIPEQGLAAPGEIIIGADSHTCTYGALGAFSTGIGSTDMAAGMATGLLWFKVPSAIKVTLTGKLQPFVSGKDVILHLIGLIGVDGALYQSLEFAGDGSPSSPWTTGSPSPIWPSRRALKTVFSRLTSRRCPIWRQGGPSVPGLRGRRGRRVRQGSGHNLDKLQPTVSLPHLPSNTRTVDEAAGMEIQQVVIGSCTNGRLKDLREAAAVLRGRREASNVRCIVIPATQQIYLDAMAEGLIADFIQAGCAGSTPTCGPCLGGHMGVMADNERTVATTNRNFVGRMGPVSSEIILANPAVAAASAVAGCVADPAKI